MNYDRRSLTDDQLRGLYEDLLLPRMIEEKMLILLRQGKISKWFSGIGQEAISIGATRSLLPDELIFPMHRNLGVFTTRQVPLERLFAQWQGKPLGFTKGRDRSFHFGTLEYGIVGMISHLGPQLALAGGVALAHELAHEGRLSIAFTGEGGTSEGDFHEALNVASVWQLPVIFVIENNGYGLSTPTSEQYRCAHLVDRAAGYGMDGHRIDGNNILDVYHTFQEVATDIRRKAKPVLIECDTFRMRGHEEASGTKYVPDELMAYWAERDPINNYEQYLLDAGVLRADDVAALRDQNKARINKALDVAYGSPSLSANVADELADVAAPEGTPLPAPADDAPRTPLRFVDAIAQGLDQAMARHDRLVLMGQDIADYGGVFKITDGLMAKYGRERVRNTPLCESAIVGIGLGLSLKGYKSMVEMQFADFVTCGFNQIVNNLAKLHYRWGEPADVVIRLPAGGGVGAGPYHSQSNEAWFAHTPGLKVVFPSTPEDAKGLLLAAFEDPNPVLFFEHKALYRSITSDVPDAPYGVKIGEARIARSGSDCTIITYGAGVHEALRVCETAGYDAEIIDLRTLVPLDTTTIEASVRKTNRVLVLHEASQTGGFGGEIAAYIAENLFEHLDAPVMRLSALDTPVPFARDLERNYLPWERLDEKLKALLGY